MAKQYLRELAEAPFALSVEVTFPSGFDTSTVDEVELTVSRPNGTTTTWTNAQLSFVRAPSSVTITRVFAAGGGDAPVGSAGTWSVRPLCRLTGGGAVPGRTVAVPCLSLLTPS